MAANESKAEGEKSPGERIPLRCERCGGTTFSDAIETSLFVSLGCAQCGERRLVLLEDLQLYFYSRIGLQG